MHAGIQSCLSFLMQTLSADRALHQDTSLIFARAGPPAAHFVHEWINTHRHELHQDSTQGNLTRHNQACLVRLLGRCGAAD